jgi:hypothetical protein
MARYHATVQSRRSATKTFGYLATFSNARNGTPERSPGTSWIPARSALAAASGSSCRSWGCACP